MSIVLFFFVLFNTFLLFFPFLGHSEFLENITAELSSPKSDCYQNSFFVSLCTRTHTHHELVCVLQYDKQKYNTKKACVFPRGVKKLTSGEH